MRTISVPPLDIGRPLTGGRSRSARRGSALLAVMWLVAGLGVIAFAVANTVRGETERTSTVLDGTREYYLATGAIERAVLYLQWGPQFSNPDGKSKFYYGGMPVLRMPFPTGEVEVEVIPEASKLNINQAPPERLLALLAALGAPPDQAMMASQAIVDWRSPSGPETVSPFDAFYLNQAPSFRARHASLEQVDELLMVQGMTPDLYYGTYGRDAEGRMIPRGALRDCVSVFGSVNQFDANTAQPAVLLSAGVPPGVVADIVVRRRMAPFTSPQELAAYGEGARFLRLGGNSIFTLRATARLRLQDGTLSDMRRSVAALVKLMPPGYDSTYHILRWYDNAFRM